MVPNNYLTQVVNLIQPRFANNVTLNAENLRYHGVVKLKPTSKIKSLSKDKYYIIRDVDEDLKKIKVRANSTERNSRFINMSNFNMVLELGYPVRSNDITVPVLKQFVQHSGTQSVVNRMGSGNRRKVRLKRQITNILNLKDE